MEKRFILAIDQGTTSTRAMIFNLKGEAVAKHQVDLTQYFPNDGWVEHDANEIWDHVVLCCREVLKKAELKAKDILSIGITNQRETTVLWDKETGDVVGPAIVWQDRRTVDICARFKNKEKQVMEKTGLRLDPYFSATKIIWFLENNERASELAKEDQLAFGTIDSFLLWRLTGGRVHSTDITNASRTLLFNLKEKTWDHELLTLFNISYALLPEIKSNAERFGVTEKTLFDGEIPITAMIGDQQAALVGQACFEKGMIKSTYGTGCFLMLNTGDNIVHSQHHLLTTVAYEIQGTVHYALEGGIFCAGATIKWLRDQLGLIKTPEETEAYAKQLESNEGVYLIPAFTGLGAPHWLPDARAQIVGLTRDSGKAHIIRAALEAVAYQTRDLLEAMQQDTKLDFSVMRVDGGLTHNEWFLQFLSDMLNLPLERQGIIEMTALGAAYCAGLGAGYYKSLEDIAALPREQKNIIPAMASDTRETAYKRWQGVLNHAKMLLF